MKFITLRDVTLVLLFALLAAAAYAGSSGTTPEQRENRRGQNNNGGQRQQGPLIPRGGVQVLPEQHGGVNLGQFNRRPGNPQNPNEADADTRNNPVAGPAATSTVEASPEPRFVTGMNLADDARQVYAGARVKPPSIPRSWSIPYTGKLNFVDGVPSLDPSGILVLSETNSRLVGQFRGGGANSKVYRSSNDKAIKKFVYLGSNKSGDTRTELGLATLLEQDVGRAILGDIKKAQPDAPFDVVKRLEDLLPVKAVADDGREHWFALSRGQNISAEEVITRPDGQFGQLAETSNAQDRRDARGPDHRGGTTSLTPDEEFTVNFVVRKLNKYGVVWTDHKLKNFDIVPDLQSFTGYRVLFFDLDGFHPVKGRDRATRAQTAREFQKIYDSSTKDGLLYNSLQAYAKQLGLENYQQAFDSTAFGHEISCCITTVGANAERKTYAFFNAMNDNEFTQVVPGEKRRSIFTNSAH